MLMYVDRDQVKATKGNLYKYMHQHLDAFGESPCQQGTARRAHLRIMYVYVYIYMYGLCVCTYSDSTCAHMFCQQGTAWHADLRIMYVCVCILTCIYICMYIIHMSIYIMCICMYIYIHTHTPAAAAHPQLRAWHHRIHQHPRSPVFVCVHVHMYIHDMHNVKVIVKRSVHRYTDVYVQSAHRSQAYRQHTDGDAVRRHCRCDLSCHQPVKELPFLSILRTAHRSHDVAEWFGVPYRRCMHAGERSQAEQSEPPR